ncbi:MAG: tyrosine-type recombinase/integrase [Chloroflexi bacterium]|nr:tyrosine-type recombinase/integrase [Chloroflexota bacterium]
MRVVLRAAAASTISGKIHRAALRAGVDLSAHSLRHHFVENLFAQGVDARTVQALARHSSLQVTSRYAGVRDGVMAEAVEKLERIAVRGPQPVNEQATPDISASPLVRAMLEDLVRFLRDQDGVWFASHQEIARFVAPK